MTYARQTVTVDIGEASLRILDQHDELIKTVPPDQCNGQAKVAAVAAATSVDG